MIKCQCYRIGIPTLDLTSASEPWPCRKGVSADRSCANAQFPTTSLPSSHSFWVHRFLPRRWFGVRGNSETPRIGTCVSTLVTEIVYVARYYKDQVSETGLVQNMFVGWTSPAVACCSGRRQASPPGRWRAYVITLDTCVSVLPISTLH